LITSDAAKGDSALVPTLPPRTTGRNTGQTLISAAMSHACNASTGRNR
jgi:hypothetical protein